MKLLKLLLISLFIAVGSVNGYSQLKKSSTVEVVKKFTHGTVPLMVTKTEDYEIYSVKLRNNNPKLFEDVILFLGTKEEMIKNLQDLSEAIETAKKGEFFDFEGCSTKYQLTLDKVFGYKCFKVWQENNTKSDFGVFYQQTMNDILKYFKELDSSSEE